MDRKSILQKVKDIGKYLMEDTIAKDFEEVKLAQESLENGTVIEAEAFEPDNAVFIVNEDERVPLPVGEYELADGQMLVVAEEGIISEIKAKEAEGDDAEGDVDAEVETVTMEMFNELREKVEQLLSSQVEASKVKEELELELSKEKEEKVKLQKKVDEIPDAEVIKLTPKVELKQVPAKTSKGRLYQFLNNK